MKTLRTVIRRIPRTVCALLLVGVIGCASQQTAARSPKGELLREAEEYALDLKAHNKLPGYRSNEHGRVIASAPWEHGDVVYPATVTVQA
jgi:hypothetical protein